MSDVSNNDRFLFIVFYLWCQRHSKDHTKEDFSQVLHIPPEERDGLDIMANYQIIKGGLCPICWGKHNTKVKPLRGGKLLLTCGYCKTQFHIDPTFQSAELVEK